MNLQKLDGLLTVVNDLLNIDGGASEETVAPLLQQVYTEVVGKYQPLIHALPNKGVRYLYDTLRTWLEQSE